MYNAFDDASMSTNIAKYYFPWCEILSTKFFRFNAQACGDNPTRPRSLHHQLAQQVLATTIIRLLCRKIKILWKHYLFWRTGPITMFTHFRMRDGMPLWQAVTSSGTASYCWSLQLKTNRYIRKGLQGPGVGQLHSEDEGPGNGVNNLEN